MNHVHYCWAHSYEVRYMIKAVTNYRFKVRRISGEYGAYLLGGPKETKKRKKCLSGPRGERGYPGVKGWIPYRKIDCMYSSQSFCTYKNEQYCLRTFKSDDKLIF